MGRPWGAYAMSEWLWAQLRHGFRRGPVSMVPDIDMPGCENGTVTDRRWLGWRQANAVSVFGVQLIREIVAALAADGISPAQSWLVQQTRTTGWGGYKGLFDSTGTANGAYLISAVAVPSHTVSVGRVRDRVLADSPHPIVAVNERYPQQGVGPYGFAIGRRPVAQLQYATRDDPDLDYITVTSPTYYCRYYTVSNWPGTAGSRRWPLDPAAEREPIIYNQPPRQRSAPRHEVAASAEYAMALVKEWGEFLGFEVESASSSRWQRETDPTAGDFDRYVVRAPVRLTATVERMSELAQPHSPVWVCVGSRVDPARAGKRYPLVRIRWTHGFPGSAEITDPDADGRYELVLRSTAFPPS